MLCRGGIGISILGIGIGTGTGVGVGVGSRSGTDNGQSRRIPVPASQKKVVICWPLLRFRCLLIRASSPIRASHCCAVDVSAYSILRFDWYTCTNSDSDNDHRRTMSRGGQSQRLLSAKYNDLDYELEM